MKPIEKGCLAIIINSRAGNNGVSVTVGKCMGRHEVYNEPKWEIDIELIGVLGSKMNHALESQLLRIDGYEETEASESQLELVE